MIKEKQIKVSNNNKMFKSILSLELLVLLCSNDATGAKVAKLSNSENVDGATNELRESASEAEGLVNST